MCTKYWLTACPGKSVVRWTDRPAMTIAVDLGRKATKQTNKQTKQFAKLLDGLNVHIAPGPDGLNARVLKECSNEISPILALIFNESLAWRDVPDEWRQANPYGKAVFVQISDEYAANILRTALFTVIVRYIFTSCREYPAKKVGLTKKWSLNVCCLSYNRCIFAAKT